jgi:hypothetical protein
MISQLNAINQKLRGRRRLTAVSLSVRGVFRAAGDRVPPVYKS